MSTTSCNSNYTTHCMMKKCGVDSKRNWGRTAPGWDHRMKTCKAFSSIPAISTLSNPLYPSFRPPGSCGCVCKKWELIDDEWCADEPQEPIIQADPRPVPPKRLDPYEGVPWPPQGGW
jgi:hypothetical protein